MSEVASQLLALSQTTGAIATAIGGVLLVVGARKLAVQVLIGAVGLIALGAVLPGLLALLASLPLLDILGLASAALGVVALLARRKALGVGLLWPLFARWLVWPLVQPYAGSLPLGPTLVILAPLIGFIAIRLLQQVLTLAYGPAVADHVAGTYLVRLLDMFGRAIMGLFLWPGRLVGWLFRH